MSTDLQHLLRHFPGTVTIESQTVAFFDALFGPDRRGFVAMAQGTGPHYTAAGKYAHHGWREKKFVWPDQLNAIVQFTRRASVTGDVYVCPALRTGRERRKDHPCAPAGWAWCDVDGPWTEARATRFEPLAVTGAFSVLSGSGRHLYVPLAEDVDQAELEAANRALVGLFGGDAKWAANSLLRPPGSWSYKAFAATGACPVPVLLDRNAHLDVATRVAA